MLYDLMQDIESRRMNNVQIIMGKKQLALFVKLNDYFSAYILLSIRLCIGFKNRVSGKDEQKF